MTPLPFTTTIFAPLGFSGRRKPQAISSPASRIWALPRSATTGSEPSWAPAEVVSGAGVICARAAPLAHPIEDA
jgi:hypothetical protein